MAGEGGSIAGVARVLFEANTREFYTDLEAIEARWRATLARMEAEGRGRPRFGPPTMLGGGPLGPGPYGGAAAGTASQRLVQAQADQAALARDRQSAQITREAAQAQLTAARQQAAAAQAMEAAAARQAAAQERLAAAASQPARQAAAPASAAVSSAVGHGGIPLIAGTTRYAETRQIVGAPAAAAGRVTAWERERSAAWERENRRVMASRDDFWPPNMGAGSRARAAAQRLWQEQRGSLGGGWGSIRQGYETERARFDADAKSMRAQGWESDFRSFNDFLQDESGMAHLRDVPDWSKGWTHEQETIGKVNRAIRQSDPLRRDLAVYRGERGVGAPMGGIYDRPLSTSLSRGSALPYADPTGRGSTKGLMRIVIPEGTKVGWHGGEDEVVLPSGTELRRMSDGSFRAVSREERGAADSAARRSRYADELRRREALTPGYIDARTAPRPGVGQLRKEARTQLGLDEPPQPGWLRRTLGDAVRRLAGEQRGSLGGGDDEVTRRQLSQTDDAIRLREKRRQARAAREAAAMDEPGRDFGPDEGAEHGQSRRRGGQWQTWDASTRTWINAPTPKPFSLGGRSSVEGDEVGARRGQRAVTRFDETLGGLDYSSVPYMDREGMPPAMRRSLEERDEVAARDSAARRERPSGISQQQWDSMPDSIRQQVAHDARVSDESYERYQRNMRTLASKSPWAVFDALDSPDPARYAATHADDLSGARERRARQQAAAIENQARADRMRPPLTVLPGGRGGGGGDGGGRPPAPPGGGEPPDDGRRVGHLADETDRYTQAQNRANQAARGGRDNFERLGRSADRGGGFIRSAARNIAYLGGTIGGIYLVGRAFHAATADLVEHERVAAQTKAVIESTGGVASVTAKHVDELAKSLQRKSRFDDEQIIASENMLLTFKNIRNVAGENNDVFDQATKVLADMGAAFNRATGGTDGLQRMTIQLGRALNDPIKGVTALTRIGVTFDDQQKDQIKTLQQSGDMLGAQKIILEELRSEFGGSAAASVDTFAGKIIRLRHQLADSAASIMEAFIPALNDAADRFDAWVNSPGFATGLQNFTTFVRDDLVPMLETLFGILQIGIGIMRDFSNAVGGAENALKILMALFVANKVLTWAGAIRGSAIAVTLLGTASATTAAEVGAVGASSAVAATGVAGLLGRLGALARIGAIAIPITVTMNLLGDPKGSSERGMGFAGLLVGGVAGAWTGSPVVAAALAGLGAYLGSKLGKALDDVNPKQVSEQAKQYLAQQGFSPKQQEIWTGAYLKAIYMGAGIDEAIDAANNTLAEAIKNGKDGSGNAVPPGEKDFSALPKPMQLRESRARNRHDDAALRDVLEDEKAYLQRQLRMKRKKPLSISQKIVLVDAMTKIDDEIAALDKTAEDNRDKAQAARDKAAADRADKRAKSFELPARIDAGESAASRTKRDTDDLKWWNQEKAFLKKQLHRANLTYAEQKDLNDRLDVVEGQITALFETRAAKRAKAKADREEREDLLIQRAQARAGLTPDPADDLRALNAEERRAKARLEVLRKKKKLSNDELREQIALYNELADIRARRTALLEKDAADSKAASKAQLASLMADQESSFFSQFGSNVFGGLTAGATPSGSSSTSTASGKGVGGPRGDVTIHVHTNAPATPGLEREIIYARDAGRRHFDG